MACLSLPNVLSVRQEAAPTEKPRVEEFIDRVLTKADVAKISGEAICSFAEIFFAAPRGRYELEACFVFSF